VAILGDLAVDFVDRTSNRAADRRNTWILADDHWRNYQHHDHWIDCRRAIDLDWDHARDPWAVLIQQIASPISAQFHEFNFHLPQRILPLLPEVAVERSLVFFLRLSVYSLRFSG